MPPETDRDPRLWAVLREPGTLAAECLTRFEAEEAAAEIGATTILPPVVVDLAATRNFRAAMRELRERGYAIFDGKP